MLFPGLVISTSRDLVIRVGSGSGKEVQGLVGTGDLDGFLRLGLVARLAGGQGSEEQQDRYAVHVPEDTQAPWPLPSHQANVRMC